MEELYPYQKYKDSGLLWIGNVPKHWEIKAIKHTFKFVTGFTPSTSKQDYYDGDLDWITISDMNDRIVTESRNKITQKAVDDLCKSVIPRNSLLYSFKLSVGKVAFAGKDLYTNEAIFSILPDDNNELNYYYYCLPTVLIHNANENIYGAKLLNQDLILNSLLPFPSKEEQQQISAYLDFTTNRINTIIKQKETLVGRLEDKRAAIINEVVTKGLNPDVPMKDSGIEWVGMIPKHWKINKIGRSFNCIGSGSTPKSSNSKYYEDGYINWLNTGDLNDNKITKTSKKITDLAFKETSALRVYPINSVVIALYGATIGKLGLLDIETTTNQACCVILDSKDISQYFLFYFLYASREYIISLAYGGGQPNISQELIKQLSIVYPDSSIEQQQIIDFIKEKTNKIDTITSELKIQIEKLKEYRQSVIADAVTGKVDLRNWQQPLI